MPKRLILTVIFMRINTILCSLFAFPALWAILTSEGREKDIWAFIFAVLATDAVISEVTVRGLKELKFWAWVVALILCGGSLFSLFAPLASLGLWGLLDSESRAAFLRQPGNNP